MSAANNQTPDLLEVLSRWIEQIVINLFTGFIKKPIQIAAFILVGTAFGFGLAFFKTDMVTSEAIVQIEKVNVRTMMSALNDLNVLIRDKNLEELSDTLNITVSAAAELLEVQTQPLRNFAAEGGSVNKLPAKILVASTSVGTIQQLDSAFAFFFKESSGLSRAADQELRYLKKRESVLEAYISDSIALSEPYENLLAELELIEVREKMEGLSNSVTFLKGFTPRNQLNPKPVLHYSLFGDLAGWLLFGLFAKRFERD